MAESEERTEAIDKSQEDENIGPRHAVGVGSPYFAYTYHDENGQVCTKNIYYNPADAPPDISQEEKVLTLTTEVWNEFLKLDPQHSDERRDFCDAIHTCQRLIGMRFAREARPDLFPIKIKKEEDEND